MAEYGGGASEYGDSAAVLLLPRRGGRGGGGAMEVEDMLLELMAKSMPFMRFQII